MLICSICNKKFNSLKGLILHLIQSHDISKEEYYLRYIIKNTENIGKCKCQECNNTTKFVNFTIGYRQFCSRKCQYKSKDLIERRKQTNLKKYGVEYPGQSEEFKEKIRQTCLDKYGTEYVFQNTEVKEKIKNTFVEKYSTDNPSRNEEIKKKKQETCFKNYGVLTPFKSEEVINKYKKNLIEKYGVDNPSKLNDVKDKRKNTCLKKYGVEYASQSDEFKEKSKQTCLERYGTEYSSQSEKVRIKIEQTNLTKYGVTTNLKLRSVIDRIRNTKNNIYYNKLLHSTRLNTVEPLFDANEYKGIEHLYSWKCKKCNTIFKDHLDNGRVPRCPTCYPKLVGTSIGEQEIFSFIQQYFPDAENGNRTILNGKELDIYIPSKQFAIEFNGLYWHSEINGNHDKNYHLNKTLQCAEKGIKLIHIFEDEWIDKQEIVKSILLSKLQSIKNKIHARKCIVKIVDNSDAFLFLDNNHLQGSISGNHIGLYYNNELVSILTYGKPRFSKEYELEILRFCNKLNTIVTGGLSKLLSKLQSNSIITYVDRRYGSGYGYINFGFNLIRESKPSYYYVKEYNRFNRIGFQKHKLNNLLKEFDSNLTEWQNMQLSDYDRIWDCGNLVYELKK